MKQANLFCLGFTGKKGRTVRGRITDEAGYHVEYDLWRAGKYPEQDKYSNLHAFLCQQGTIRRFSNHQQQSNGTLINWYKEFDALVAVDDKEEGENRKSWQDLVNKAKTNVEEKARAQPESQPVLLSVVESRVPCITPDMEIQRAVEQELLVEERKETSLEEMQNVISKEKRQCGYTTSASRPNPECLYPSVHKHELYMFVEKVLLPREYAPPEPDSETPLTFPLPSEHVHIPDSISSDLRIMAMLGGTHSWCKPTREGLVCRSCEDATKKQGCFVGNCLKWGEVPMRLASRGKEHTEGTRSGPVHTTKWNAWLDRHENTRRTGGAARDMVNVANERAWMNNVVEGLLNTQVLARVFHDLQFCCSHNRPLTTTLKELRERDGYFDPEQKAFNTRYYNLTSPTIVSECLRIMERVTRNKVIARVQASPFVSLLTDETQDTTRLSQHATMVRVIDATNFSTHELLWNVAPLKDEQTADKITDFLVQECDGLGVAFWGKLASFASDGCNTMGGHKSGVQLRIKIKKAPYTLWACCRAHALNLVAQHVVADHAVIQASYELVQGTYRALYRGRGDGTAKLRLFQECVSAVKSIDAFGFWRERELCAVADTRWCSHERCASTLTSVLGGVVLCFDKLDSDKGREMKAAYQSSSSVVGIFLMEAVMSIMGKLSRCLQHPQLCFSDICGLVATYSLEIGKLKEYPHLFPKYVGAWIIINAACPQQTINEAFVLEYHKRYAVPYLSDLKAELESKHEDFTVLSSFGLYDPRSADFSNISSARKKLAVLTGHFCEPQQFTLVTTDGHVQKTEPTQPYFSTQDRHALESELEGALAAIKKETEELCKGKTSFAKIIQTFLQEQINRIKFPHTTRVLLLCLAVPLSTSSVERLFSKLKIIKNRLSNRMTEQTLSDEFLVSVEGELTQDGIPREVLEQYVTEFISEDRKLQYRPLPLLIEAQQFAAKMRKSHHKSWWQ